MADAAPVQGLSKTPADFLKSIKGKHVVVKLNSGVDYRGVLPRGAARRSCTRLRSRGAVCLLAVLAPPPSFAACANCQPAPAVLPAGVLACLDGYMNIAMEQTEEYVNGQLKNKYGDAFIRGNNGGFARVRLLDWGGEQFSSAVSAAVCCCVWQGGT